MLNDEGALERSLNALTQYFIGDRSMLETLTRVAEMSTEAIPSAAFAGLTMMHDGSPETAVFTDPESPTIDRAQYESGAGPCLESFRTGAVVTVESTRDDPRWPEFARTCVDHGVLSTMSVPMTVDGSTNGALNLYARAERAFGAGEIRTGRLFAAQAAIVVANAAAYWTARARAAQLEEALSTRGVIEQAKGIIMATTRCTADDAFAILVQQSQRQNRKVNEIAAEIVRNTSERP